MGRDFIKFLKAGWCDRAHHCRHKTRLPRVELFRSLPAIPSTNGRKSRVQVKRLARRRVVYLAQKHVRAESSGEKFRWKFFMS